MLTTPSSLVEQIASLRTASADRAGSWLTSALHALIAALLARLFGRLERLAQLWQAGELPQPTMRRPISALPRRADKAATHKHAVPRPPRLPASLFGLPAMAPPEAEATVETRRKAPVTRTPPRRHRRKRAPAGRPKVMPPRHPSARDPPNEKQA